MFNGGKPLIHHHQRNNSRMLKQFIPANKNRTYAQSEQTKGHVNNKEWMYLAAYPWELCSHICSHTYTYTHIYIYIHPSRYRCILLSNHTYQVICFTTTSIQNSISNHMFQVIHFTTTYSISSFPTTHTTCNRSYPFW